MFEEEKSVGQGSFLEKIAAIIAVDISYKDMFKKFDVLEEEFGLEKLIEQLDIGYLLSNMPQFKPAQYQTPRVTSHPRGELADKIRRVVDYPLYWIAQRDLDYFDRVFETIPRSKDCLDPVDRLKVRLHIEDTSRDAPELVKERILTKLNIEPKTTDKPSVRSLDETELNARANLALVHAQVLQSAPEEALKAVQPQQATPQRGLQHFKVEDSGCATQQQETFQALSNTSLRNHNRREELRDFAFKKELTEFSSHTDVIGRAAAPDPVLCEMAFGRSQNTGPKLQSMDKMCLLVTSLVNCLDAIVEDYKSQGQTSSDLHKEGFIFLLNRLRAVCEKLFLRFGIWADAANLDTGPIISKVTAMQAGDVFNTVSMPMLFNKIANSIEACGLIDDENILQLFPSLAMGRIGLSRYNLDRDVFPMKFSMSCLKEVLIKDDIAQPAYFKLLSSRLKLFYPNSLRGRYPSRTLFGRFSNSDSCNYPCVIYGSQVVDYLLSADRTPDQIYEAIDVLSYYGYEDWLGQLNESANTVDMVCQNIPACTALLRNAKQRFDFGGCLEESASKTHILFTVKVLKRLLKIDLSSIDSEARIDLQNSAKTLSQLMICQHTYAAEIKKWFSSKGISSTDLQGQLDGLDKKLEGQIGQNSARLGEQPAGGSAVTCHATLRHLQKNSFAGGRVPRPNVFDETSSLNGL